MTPAERDHVMAAVAVPGRRRGISARALARRLGAKDLSKWTFEQLQRAADEQNAEDLEWALVAGFDAGLDSRWRDLAARLLGERWHTQHEGLVAVLAGMPDASSLDVLSEASQWGPQDLEFDESRALARKAIHAIAKLPGEDADATLRRLAAHEDHTLRAVAERQLAYAREGE